MSKLSSCTDRHAGLEINRKTMNGKPVYEIVVKEVMNFASRFAEKGLCDGITFSLGSACAFSCLLLRRVDGPQTPGGGRTPQGTQRRRAPVPGRGPRADRRPRRHPGATDPAASPAYPGGQAADRVYVPLGRLDLFHNSRIEASS